MRKLNKNPTALCQGCAKTLVKFVYPQNLCSSCYYQNITRVSRTINGLLQRIKTLKMSEGHYIKQNRKLKKALGKIRVREILGG